MEDYQRNYQFVVCEVYFQEGPMLSILRYNWLVGSNCVTQFCLWPPKKGSAIKMPKTGCMPVDNWIQFKCD